MKFSIITPTYNRADLIERAIKSVLSQSYANFEMIIIDDASTDNTTEVVNYFLYDRRIKFVKSEVNVGVNKVRNIGLNLVSDDVDAVTFLDSDDEFEFDALEKMLFELNNHKEINYFRFGVKYESGALASNMGHANKTTDFSYYIKNLFSIGEWVCTFRKSVIDDGFRYSHNVKAFEILSYINLARIENLYFSNKTVRIYHTGHDSISSEKFSEAQLKNSINGYEIILNENPDLQEISAKNFSTLALTLANLYILDGKKVKGLKLTMSSFLKHPSNLRIFRNLINFIIK